MHENTTTAGLLQQLKERVTAMQTSEAWMEHLKAVSCFHHYSFNNILLIQMQRPGASRVAGYRTWQALGRQVRKGEHGIRILAPLVVKRRHDDAAQAQEEAGQVVVGFRTVAVFDVSQTEGKPLPEEDIFRTLEGSEEKAGALFERLARFAEEDLRLAVAVERIEGSAKGFLQYAPARIVVGEQYAPLQRCKTLAHELGHAILHREEKSAGEYLDSRPVMEMEAESVAYVVMQRFGLDSADYTIPYLASWAQGDAEQLLRSGARIQQAAGRILDACLKEHGEEREAEAA